MGSLTREMNMSGRIEIDNHGATSNIVRNLAWRIHDAEKNGQKISLLGFKSPRMIYMTQLTHAIIDALEHSPADCEIKVFKSTGDRMSYVMLNGANLPQATQLVNAVDQALPQIRRPARAVVAYRPSQDNYSGAAQKLYDTLMERVQEAAAEQFPQEAEVPVSYAPA